MELQLTGKVAIVTGAGRGVGEAIAKRLAAAGAHIAVNDINPDRAERVAGEIRAAGGRAMGVAADVANKFQCVHLVETTRAEWGRLDILVNHAAVAPTASILKMDEWEWDRCLDVNLKGIFFMSQLCGRVMADENKAHGGAIVNVSSVAGVTLPWPDRAAYCASQAGITGFARECAREFAQYGIRVNTVLSNPFDIKAGLPIEEKSGKLEIPLSHSSQPEEIAAVVLFLCSSVATHISGTAVTIGC